MGEIRFTDERFDMVVLYQALSELPIAAQAQGCKLSAITSTTRDDLMKRIEKVFPGIAY